MKFIFSFSDFCQVSGLVISHVPILFFFYAFCVAVPFSNIIIIVSLLGDLIATMAKQSNSNSVNTITCLNILFAGALLPSIFSGKQ